MNFIINDLAANIKYYRKRRGLTQEELAEMVGLSFQAVSKWENAKAVPDALDLPSYAFRRGLINIDSANKNARLLLTAVDGGYHVRTLEETV